MEGEGVVDYLDSFIQDSEYLYRGVVDKMWLDDYGRPSSGIFTDSFGISVDRDGGRVKEDCLKTLFNTRKFKAICRIKTADVRAIEAYPVYKPTIDNIYHSEIHDSEDKIQITSKRKARALLAKSEIITN